MLTPETFLVLERSLTRRLKETWEPIGARIVRALMKAFNEDDFETIDKVLVRIKLERALEGNVKYARTIGYGAIVLGASRLRDTDDVLALEESGVKAIVGRSVTQMRMILISASDTVRSRIYRALNNERDRQQKEKNSVKKAEIVSTFASNLGMSLMGGGEMLDLASSLHASRLSSFGFTVEAKLMGETQARINAMLDSRTCPVCVHMDQGIVQVDRYHETLLQVFAADTVEDLKRLAPWQSTSRAAMEGFRSLSSEEIMSRGVMVPFHALCRCFIDYVERPVELIETITTPIPGLGALQMTTMELVRERAMQRAVIESVEFAGLDVEMAATIVESLDAMVAKYGARVNRLQTIDGGAGFLKMERLGGGTDWTLSANTTLFSKHDNVASVNEVIFAGHAKGAHLASDLNELVIHEYGYRMTLNKVLAADDWSLVCPGLTVQGRKNLSESVAELFLKREISILTEMEHAFLEAYL